MKQKWPRKSGNKVLRTAWEQRAKLRAEGSKLRAEGNKLYAEGDKLWAEGDKLLAEGDKLWAEGDKLYAEGSIVWLDAVISVYGPRTKITWNYLATPATCTLETE